MKNRFLLLKSNKFLSNSILYVIGSMMTPAIGIIMMPIYTHYLDIEKYGIMTTIQTLAGLFQLLLLLSLHGAVTRFYYDFLDDKVEQKRYLGSIFLFVLIFSTVMAILLIFLYKPIGSILFSEIPIKPYYFYLIGLAWVNSLIVLPLALWRAEEKAGTYVVFNLLKSILIMTATSFLLIVKGQGIISILTVNIVISIIFIFISYLMTRKSYSLNLNLNYIKASLLFSLPLIPHVASSWIIKSSDRVILEKFVSLDELGLYSLAVQVAVVMSLFYTGVNNALVPRYTKLRKEGKIIQANKLLKIFMIIIIFSGLAAIPIALYSMDILASNEYAEAKTFIPILIIGEVIKGFYFIPVAKLFYIKSTKAIAVSSIIAALVNISFNFILIPLLGVYGAALSTIIAEVIRFSLIFIASRKSKEYS